jgi:hypothetical protein
MTAKKKVIEKTCANCKTGLAMDEIQKKEGRLAIELGIQRCVACTRNPGSSMGGGILAMIGIVSSDRWEAPE